MWFNKSPQEAITKLSSNILKGLSTEEAKRRLSIKGKNKIIDQKKKSLLRLFLSQLNDAMIFILIGASIISSIMGEFTDSLVIILVIMINAIIGVMQESKAKKALEALKELSTPKALVKRDGVLKEIPSEEIVVGDIVIVDAGRYIPADIRLIESINLKIDESAFTGESLPTEKDASLLINQETPPIGDIKNMLFMSTLVTYGRGTGIVVETGMNTELGKIAKMLYTEEENTTPLQKRLSSLGKTLGLVALAICILMFLISILQGRNCFEMLLTSISLAVAAIPEGLPAIVAIVLALGVQRMIKENAIVRKLPAVETLGSVSIICSDKTGTLTLNKMTVKEININTISKSIDEFNINDSESKLLIEGMVLCNDSTSNKNSKTGDPTEIALLDLGIKLNSLKDDLNSKYPRINEIPFDSTRKLMTTVNAYNNSFRVFTKGAIDSLLNITTKISIKGEIKPLTNEMKTNILELSNEMSNRALRVLALSYKDIKINNETEKELESELIFLGFVGMIDPPREEVKESIKICKNAGITPVMITGDHKNTAFAIAKELDIANNIDECISGIEIDKYTQNDFNKIVSKYNVFARVSPEHKVKIVKAFKSQGNIVSMTGDGVNDAPSLKAADIGIAMGITGTDVAKGAADMILTDDNFSTIVTAIEEGRNIYNNIKKSIIFLLSCNLGEIFTLFIAILLNFKSPLLPIHILWVNLITDSFPALSLGVDPLDKNLMDELPRNKKESLFSKDMIILLIFNGILIGISTLFAFKLGEYLYSNSLRHAQTLSFVVLSISQLFFSFSMRNTKKSIFKTNIFSNKYLLGSFLLGILIQILIISIPFLASIFKVYSLTFTDWLLAIVISLLPLIFNELYHLLLGFKKH